MVEFDDGDRGRISLSNIRLLPPGYQIHCGYIFIKSKRKKKLTDKKTRDIFNHFTILLFRCGALPSTSVTRTPWQKKLHAGEERLNYRESSQ